MSVAKIIGVLLIAAGAMGLLYGGFSYTKESHTAKLGPLAITVQDRETVMIPVVASLGSIVLGVFLILGTGRTKQHAAPACLAPAELVYRRGA